MTGSATLLREIHRLKRHATELRQTIDRGPKLLQAQRDRISRTDDLLKQTQDKNKHLKVTAHEKETTIKAKVTLIAKYERQLNEIKEKKEYDALKHEIAGAKAEIAQLEDEILEHIGETDELTAKIPVLQKALEQTKMEVAQYERDYDTRQADLKAELEKTVQALKEGEAVLPPDISQQYNRVMAAKGDDGLCAVMEKTCTACYTAITPQNYNDLLSERVVLCKSCGRFLYLPE